MMKETLTRRSVREMKEEIDVPKFEHGLHL